MAFRQIIIVDYTGLHGFAIDKLQSLSTKTVKAYNTIPNNDDEIIDRIGNADCVFVSWNTPISENVMRHCNKIKYIGMCCSLIDEDSANVDVRFAKSRGIVVKGIRDYGDEGVTEFVISELVQLLKGLGKHMWKSEPVELTKRKVGIVGLGTTGLMLAQRLKAFGADLYYYSRAQKSKAVQLGIEYLPLNELIEKCEILSFHLPRHTQVLEAEHFETLGNNKILVNTSLGLTFDKEAFKKWVSRAGNYAIFDVCGFGAHKEELSQLDHLIFSEKTSGWTREAKERLSYKVLDNVNVYLNELK